MNITQALTTETCSPASIDFRPASTAASRTGACSTLVARRFTYRLELSQHPDYPLNLDAFTAAVSAPELTFVSELLNGDDEDDDEAVGHEAGFVVNAQLNCDAGSPLWQRLVKARVLEGADAMAPRHVSIGSVAALASLALEKAAARDAIAAWLTLGPETLFNTSSPELLDAIPQAVQLRDLGQRTEALSRLAFDERSPASTWSPGERWLWQPL